MALGVVHGSYILFEWGAAELKELLVLGARVKVKSKSRSFGFAQDDTFFIKGMVWGGYQGDGAGVY